MRSRSGPKLPWGMSQLSLRYTQVPRRHMSVARYLPGGAWDGSGWVSELIDSSLVGVWANDASGAQHAGC